MKHLTIEGANEADELKRLAAFQELQEQDTEILLRLVELGQMPRAVHYLKNQLAFTGLKMFLNK